MFEWQADADTMRALVYGTMPRPTPCDHIPTVMAGGPSYGGRVCPCGRVRLSRMQMINCPTAHAFAELIRVRLAVTAQPGEPFSGLAKDKDHDQSPPLATVTWTADGLPILPLPKPKPIPIPKAAKPKSSPAPTKPAPSHDFAFHVRYQRRIDLDD